MAGLGLVGCGSTQVGSTAGSTDKTGKTAVKEVKDMDEKEEEEAWKKEPAYGKTLKVGYNGGLCLGGFGIAKVNGYYKDEGLDCEIVSMKETTDAIGTGKVDVAGDHIATLLVPATNGVKLTFTLGCQTGCKSLYVLANGPISKTSDLVGKTVAVPEGIGTSDQNIAMRFLNHDDVDVNQVKWKPVTNDAVVQALQNDEVQAATLSDQFARKFLDDGTLKIIRSLTYDKDFQKEPCCIVTFNSDFIKKNPVTAKKFTRAFKRASDWIEDNTKEAVDIMFDNNWASGDKAIAYDLTDAFNFKISEQMTHDALLDIIKDYKKFGTITSKDSAQDILDRVWAPVLG